MAERERRPGRPNKGYVPTTLSLKPDILKAAKIYAVMNDTTVSDIANEAIARFVVGSLQNQGKLEEVEAVVQRVVGKTEANPPTPQP